MENPSFNPDHDDVPNLNPELPYPRVNDKEAATTEVAASSIGVRHDHKGTMEVITTELPYGCSMQGWLDDPKPDGSRVYNPGYIRVNPVLREQQIGKRLARASLAYAIDHGATELSAFVVNEASLKVLGGILSDELEYQAEDPSASWYKPIDVPITDTQAIDSLIRASDHEADPEDRKHGFMITADLSRIDVSSWERPTVQS